MDNYLSMLGLKLNHVSKRAPGVTEVGKKLNQNFIMPSVMKKKTALQPIGSILWVKEAQTLWQFI